MKLAIKFSKKGQFYIFTALILCGFTMIALMTTPKIGLVEKSFAKLEKNYIAEESKVINSGIYGGNLSIQYDDFVVNFLDYSKTRNQEFGLIYIINTYENMSVGNKISKPINITANNVIINLPASSVITIEKTNFINIKFEEYSYDFNISGNVGDTRLLFWTKKGDDIRVYLKK